VHDLQLGLHSALTRGDIGNVVLFVEHEPVITLGRGAHIENLLASEAELSTLGVDLAKTGRGGDITLHAPGQLVCYPIVDLNPDRRDVRRYVKDLTECMRRVAAHYGVASGPIERHIGLWSDLNNPRVWAGDGEARTLAKIGAIGVRVSRWITMHGYALNLHPNLDLYRLIVPCGISDHPVASVQSLGGHPPALGEAASHALQVLAELLDCATGTLVDGTTLPLSVDAVGRQP
jgi:lipoyl(octanoyl) transferase